MSPKLKNLGKNLALSLFSFFFCIAIIEVTLRMMGFGNVEVYQPDQVTYWKLKPNQNCFTKIDHKPVRVNSLSTRGPEFSPEKPANVLRILSLGDSRTFGWGVSEEEAYSGLLQKLLQETAGPSRTVEVINAGVNAWSYYQMEVYLREFGLKYQPDFVIIGDGNLWTQFSETTSPEFKKSFLRRVALKNFLRKFAIYHYIVENKLQKFYETYRTKFIPVDPKNDTLFKEQQQKDPDAFFRARIENMHDLCEKAGAKPVLLFLPVQTDIQTNRPSAIRDIKKELSEKTKCLFVDVTDAIQPKVDSLYLDADPVHFNAEGNRIIAQRLFETLAPLVKP